MLPTSIKRRALQLLLRPALRYCIRNSLGIKELLDAAKNSLVSLAAEEIETGGYKVTASRIMVMTGMHRRDVKSILKDGIEKDTTPHYLQRILSQWEQDERFLSKKGTPKVLTFKSKDSEFTALVHQVRKDLGPNAVLLELERIGAVERSKQGLRMLQSVRYTTTSPEQGMELLTRDVDTLCRAVEENLFDMPDRDIRNLHLRTSYNNIYEEDIPAIRKWILKQGQDFHKKARQYLANFDQDLLYKPDKKAGKKVVITSFGWSDSIED